MFTMTMFNMGACMRLNAAFTFSSGARSALLYGAVSLCKPALRFFRKKPPKHPDSTSRPDMLEEFLREGRGEERGMCSQ